MIIKLDKLISLLFLCVLVSVSFIFAMRAEKKDSPVSAQDFRRVPVIMYHHVTKEKSKAGSYTVTTDELENDMKYISSQGYTAVSVSELIDYVYCGKELPEKSVVITFDDGFESYKVLALPIMARYNMKSAVFIIGHATDLYSKVSDHTISYSNLNWEAVKELESSPFSEVHSHTYNLHHNEKGERKGMSSLENESFSSYEKVLYKDLMKLQNLFKSKKLSAPTAIAYPYGAYDKNTTEIIKKLGFKVSFTCEGRISRISAGDPESLYNIGRFNRESGISAEEFFKDILI